MREKKYVLFISVVVGSSGVAAHTNQIEFYDKDEALAAKKEIEERHGRSAVVIPVTKAPLSKESIFLELLKANPVASPQDIWDRAETAHKLLNFHRL